MKKNLLPPELSGKYPKKRYLGPRIQETQHKLSFALYRDKGQNREKVTDKYPSNYLAPVLEVAVSTVVQSDVHPFVLITEEPTNYGHQQLIWPYQSESIIDQSVDGYEYKHQLIKDHRPFVIVSQLTLFTGVMDNKVTVPASMVRELIQKYFVPLTHDEQVNAYLNGDTPLPYCGLPYQQIADSHYTEIAHVPASSYRFDTSEKGSFRDNLR